MSESDFELILALLRTRPQSLSREISIRLRRQGHEHFSPRRTNQALYRMLSAGLVARDEGDGKPLWSVADSTNPPANRQLPLPGLPSRGASSAVMEFLIADTVVKVILHEALSPNDPYMTADWVGSHVVASVNQCHPFWQSRVRSDSERSLYSMIVALDAYVQWKIAKMSEPPDATETQMIRDLALRYCSLGESVVTQTV